MDDSLVNQAVFHRQDYPTGTGTLFLSIERTSMLDIKQRTSLGGVPVVVWLITFGLVASVIFLICCFFTYLCRLHNGCGCCCDHQQRTLIPEMPQLQANLRPYEVPIENSVTPSAPRLDQVDLPPSYEEAIKIKVS